MKHLFKIKRLHRSNETPPVSPSPSPSGAGAGAGAATSCSSDHRASSSAAAAQPSPAEPSRDPAAPAAVAGGGERGDNRQDYFSSEEEFQMQLAMALSASNSDFGSDPDGDQIRKAKLISLGRDRIDQDGERGTAESLSRRYWDYNVLDYHEKVMDGFCDIFDLSPESSTQGKMPSLADLQTSIGDLGFEVIVVNRAIDPALVEMEQIAQCIRLDYPVAEIGLLVQRIAELVTENMGGSVKDANDMLTRWIERSTELRTSLQTSLLPIGCIKIGLSRHRALLFKILADKVGISCKLVKGCHYTGVDDEAINIIKLDNDREYLVDLMADPGTLIPADVLSLEGRNYSNSNSTRNSSWSIVPSIEDLLMPEESSNNPVSDATSIYDKPSLMDGSSIGPASSSGVPPVDNSKPNNNVPSNQPAQSDSDNQDTAEDSRNLFAELNPFQISGVGKNPNLPKIPDNRNNVVTGGGGYQRRRENVASGPGRPHQPLVMKNWSAFNDGQITRRNNNIVGNINNNAAGASSSQRPPLAMKINDNFNISKVNPAISNRAEGQRIVPVQPIGGKNVDPKKSPHDRFMGDLVIGSRDRAESSVSQSAMQKRIDSRLDPMLDDVSEWEILWEDLVIGERIGLGSYGEVYRAEWNGTEVAVKKFLDQDFYGDALDEFRSEVRIMRRLRHPNVVLFMGAVTRPPNLSIVSEFLPRGSLYRLLHRPNSQIDEKRRIKMALDVAKGMNCLHTSMPTIVHRDLKSPNLLVDKNWTVKVCDFGLSRLKHNTFLSSKSTAGTPEWMAPEVLRNEPSNEKCDVYSFGVILWELATLRMPWAGMNPMQVVGAVGFQDRRLDIPKDIDPLVSRIIWECWQTDPNLRPSFAQLTTALKSLQRLAIPSVQDTQSPPVPQEIFVNSSTP